MKGKNMNYSVIVDNMTIKSQLSKSKAVKLGKELQTAYNNVEIGKTFLQYGKYTSIILPLFVYC